ncbi:hypothetical protein [Garciella nitratireducens]|uniref:CAAX protease self-immunity n=1 Tax=Garciella nitratireducens DSM 15102 TaxID=1121911 RepID=A0A1T4L4C1_9FIRM|nr:hypothetical protein [Garciella nitratireducens]SJZ49565.1 hypothetical protein SAMN02745973_00829 [Garciella nitratireducens DSM 15102]
MIEIIGGTISALIAYSLNGLVLKWKGRKSIVFLVPFLEEISKDLITFFLKANFIGTHLIFGIIEALYDWIYTKNRKAAWLAAIISVLSHSFFGICTYFLYLWTEQILFAIVIIGIIHSLWNYFITR